MSNLSFYNVFNYIKELNFNLSTLLPGCDCHVLQICCMKHVYVGFPDGQHICLQYLFQWNLVCDNEWMTSVITSSQMFGVLVGNVACGQIADLIGRKHPLFVSILSLIVLNLIAAFSTSWSMFAAIRFLIGLAMGFELTVQYNVAAEYTLARWRTWVVSIPSWAISSALFALASWALKDWQHLHFATAAVGIPALVTYWYVQY